jgi:hypothetical protein
MVQNQMQNLITRLIICLTLTVGQAVYLTARAQSIESPIPQMVAMAQPSAAQIATCKNALKEESRLVEINNQFIPGVAFYAATISGDEARRLAKDGVIIGGNSGKNYIDLQDGNILLNPEQDIVVGTKSSKIFIGAGASVFVVNSGPDVVVYDLLQTKPKQVSVTVLVNKQKIILEPGRMCVLTGQDIKNFEKLEIDCHRVAYRNAQSLDLAGSKETVKGFAADFSIASAMVTIQPLKRLTISNNKQDNMTVDRLVKGAVLLGDFASSPTLPIDSNDPPVITVKSDSMQLVSGGSNR